MGMTLSNYVVTEAGFGADLGAEKFLNIKCGYAGIKPKAIVLVATIRALRHHGGAPKDEYKTTHLDRVRKGMANLEKHIENAVKFGIKPVVSINHFVTDSEEEVQLVINRCDDLGVKAVLARGWELGGEGTTDLALAVVSSVESGINHF